jgi:hypothetical protein
MSDTTRGVQGSSRPLPQRDEDGFFDREALRRGTVQLDASGFELAYPLPALLIAGPSDLPRTPTPQDLRRALSYRQTTLSAGPRHHKSRPLAAYAGRIAFLEKRPGNPFPAMVTIGRAVNNDVVILLETVSKFHGYFTHAGDGWTLTDQRSANGLHVNGITLESTKPHPIADGDRIRFGLDLAATFLLPRALFKRIHEGTGAT